MTTFEQRNQFENKINEIVDNAIQSYGINSEEYQKNIEQIKENKMRDFEKMKYK